MQHSSKLVPTWILFIPQLIMDVLYEEFPGPKRPLNGHSFNIAIEMPLIVLYGDDLNSILTRYAISVLEIYPQMGPNTY